MGVIESNAKKEAPMRQRKWTKESGIGANVFFLGTIDQRVENWLHRGESWFAAGTDLSTNQRTRIQSDARWRQRRANEEEFSSALRRKRVNRSDDNRAK